MFLPSNKIALKLIELFSDSRILPSQWKFDIPSHMVQQQKQIVANIKNFADGVEYNLSKYNIDVEAEYIVAHRDDKMNYVNGKVDNSGNIR